MKLEQQHHQLHEVGTTSSIVLFLSLYFKALKYTVKASKKTKGAKNKKKTDKKVKAIVGFSTVSVETPSFPGY
jgi:hypothetical protein